MWRCFCCARPWALRTQLSQSLVFCVHRTQACDDYYCRESFSDASGRYGGDGTTCKASATLGSTVCKACAGKPYGQRGCRVDFIPLHLY
jgi:hypothetical protein